MLILFETISSTIDPWKMIHFEYWLIDSNDCPRLILVDLACHTMRNEGKHESYIWEKSSIHASDHDMV